MKQTANIDLGGGHFPAINAPQTSFNYDGQGYSILGFANFGPGWIEDITDYEFDYAHGLFAEVSDLTVTNLSIHATSVIGIDSGLAAQTAVLAGYVSGKLLTDRLNIYVNNFSAGAQSGMVAGLVEGGVHLIRTNAVSNTYNFLDDAQGLMIGRADDVIRMDQVNAISSRFTLPSTIYRSMFAFGIGGLVGTTGKSYIGDSPSENYFEIRRAYVDFGNIAYDSTDSATPVVIGGLIGVAEIWNDSFIRESEVVLDAHSVGIAGGLVGELEVANAAASNLDISRVKAQFYAKFDAQLAVSDSRDPYVGGLIGTVNGDVDNDDGASVNITVTDSVISTYVSIRDEFDEQEVTVNSIASAIGVTSDTSITVTDSYLDVDEWDQSDFTDAGSTATAVKFSPGVTDLSTAQLSQKTSYAFESEIGDAGVEYDDKPWEICSSSIHVSFRSGPCAAPAARTFSTVNGSYEVGKEITPITVTNESVARGQILYYQVTPSLPVGLSIDLQSGTIKGTPRIETPTTTYRVTAFTSNGLFWQGDGRGSGSITFKTEFVSGSSSTNSANPYTGPLVTDTQDFSTTVNGTDEQEKRLLISGQRLAGVTGVTAGGTSLPIVDLTDNSILVGIPASIPAGTYDLAITSSIGNLTYLDGLEVTTSQLSAESTTETSAWTKRISDTQVKVYVKYPTVGQKLRISHQTGGSGEYQTVFVKTIESETDSALITNANGSYVVRTIDLDQINRIRVTVGDNTEVQVRYNR
jgi:hypothetical protein